MWRNPGLFSVLFLLNFPASLQKIGFQLGPVQGKVKFLADLPAPIFAFSIKNVQGTEITGTNSMLEKAFLDGVKAGMTKEITYTQKIDVQGGEYLLSLGVTGYEKDTFHVYHRLYDVLNMTVVSDKNSVGFYDMNSKVTVKDA